jgi:hypothetical protein
MTGLVRRIEESVAAFTPSFIFQLMPPDLKLSHDKV